MRAESPCRRPRMRSAKWRNAIHLREGVSMAEAESVPTKQCARHECVRIRWHVSFGVSHCRCYSRNSGQRTPNDPKLRDRGGWRRPCGDAAGVAAAVRSMGCDSRSGSLQRMVRRCGRFGENIRAETSGCSSRWKDRLHRPEDRRVHCAWAAPLRRCRDTHRKSATLAYG